MHYVRYIFCFLLIAVTALAQRVTWVDAGTRDPADLQLVFEDCEPAATPVMPQIPGVTFNYRGQSTQTSIINFSRTDRTILSYRLQLRTPGQVHIPAFAVKTNKGDITVPAYSTGTVQPGPESDIQARLRPGKTTVWAGEVFPLTYSLDVAKRTFSNFGGGIEWDPSPLLTEDWSKPEVAETTRNGEIRYNIAFRTRASVKSAGTVQTQPVQQLLNLALGTVGFGLFQQQRIESVAVTTDRPEIKVQPLPFPAPAGFTGAVGQFKLNSKVVPQSSAVGEPITWTLELTGTGNWPDINGLPSRSVSQDFQVIQPQAKRTTEEGKLFDGSLSEDVVLVPTKPGTYTLGAVDFSYFDPKSGSYKTIRIPATTVTVTAAAPVTPRFNVMPEETTDTPPPAPEIKAPEPAQNPIGIPRDPIPGSDVVSVPFASLRQLLITGLAPIGAVVLIWLSLAARQARRNDPARSRREARRRLIATLNRLRSSTDRSGLLDWQHDAARLWNLHHAAPSADTLPDETWRMLWREADKTLYGENTSLPSDWIERATAALVATKVPGTAWWRALQPRNLLPFLFVMALAMIATPVQAATDAAQAYREGDFAKAEKTWRDAVTAQPTDWIARHNLSLALAQQDRWGEAAAHATAAFVQNPHDDAARWNLALAFSKAGYTPNAVAPLLEPAPLADLARLTSPAGWDCWFIIGGSLIAVALLALLLSGYQLAPAWIKWVAIIALISGVACTAASLTARHVYGIAAHPRVAVVWRSGTLYSIPTEADTAQQTTSLAAGAMGVMDEKTFLSWVKLTFPNGQTGWVRQSEIVPLYR